MTQINSSKRLENELLLLEKEDKTYPFDTLFIIKLTISESSVDHNVNHNVAPLLTENDLDKLSDIIYEVVNNSTINNKPLSMYISLSEIVFIFSTKKISYT